MLVNVGFEYRVKMLELDVSYQGNDEDLPKRGGGGRAALAAVMNSPPMFLYL